jgi:WD40 repeat protein
VKRPLLIAAMLAAALAAALAPAARAQAIRSQTNRINNAIQNQIRQAIRPRLTVRNAAGKVLSLAMTPDSKLLVIALEDHSLRLWDLVNGIEQQRIDTGSEPVATIRVSDDGRRVVTGGTSGTIAIFDAAGAAPVRRIDSRQGAIAALDLARDGATIAAAGRDRSVALWDARTGNRLASLPGGPADVTSLALSPGGTLLAAGAADGSLRLWRPAAGTPPLSLAASGAVRALRLDDSGQLISATAVGRVEIWQPNANAPQRTFRAASSAASAEINADGRYVAVSDADSRVSIVEVASGNTLRELAAPAGASSFVAVDIARHRVLTGGADGAVRVWNLGDGADLAQIISTLNGWAVVDDKGRFDGSQAAVTDVQWSANQSDLAIDNFSDAYYEPGLLAKRMSDQPSFAAPAPTAVADGIYLPPRLTVTATPGPYAEGQEVEVTVTAEDQGGGIAALRLFDNGKLVAPEALESERNATQNGAAAVIRTYRLRLIAASNRLDAIAANQQRIDAAPTRLEIVASGQPGLPTLHILTIGINKYRDHRFDLDYGVPDALAILKQLSRSTAGIFRRIVSYELLDQAATRDKIAETFAAFRAMPAGDVLVVYVASHGEIIGDEWYMLPHDTNFASLDAVAGSAIGATALRDMLSRVGAQRVLMLIDSCKSGGSIDTLAAAMDRRQLRLLGREAGIAILAAARKDEFAAELSSLGHGAFTYVVLQALSGKAAGEDAGGRVTAGAVLDYSARALPQLTKSVADYAQVPVAYRRGDDFALRAAAGP